MNSTNKQDIRTPRISTSIDPLANAKPVFLNKLHSSSVTIGSNVRSVKYGNNTESNITKTSSISQNSNNTKSENLKSETKVQSTTSSIQKNAVEAKTNVSQNIPKNTQKNTQTPSHNTNVVDTKTSITLNQSAMGVTSTNINQTLANSTKPTDHIKTQVASKVANNDLPANDVEMLSTQFSTVNDNLRTNIPLSNLSNNPQLQSLVVDINSLDFNLTKKIRAYLKKLINIGGSDLHIKAGSQIRARIQGDIVIFSEEIISKDDALTFAKELTRTRFQEFALNKELDMTYIYDSKTRFRVNIFFQMDGVSFAFRQIPTIQSTIDELGLPSALYDIVNMERGLVLVTGITGSGKSTTLAAIINEINRSRAKHIITIEDPIEFIHKDIKSMINQRSVGMDTNSFHLALKAALREDPDIILVGEMRDIDTIEMAIYAAETGHLVLSTLHTIDAKETINRIISVFPTGDQQRIRKTLGSVLSAIVSQRLLKSRDGKRTAAVEILFKTPRIETIIDEGRDGEILEALEEGKGIYKTQTFDQHLFDLVANGIVDEEVAMEKATSPSDLKLKIQNISSGESALQDVISIKQ